MLPPLQSLIPNFHSHYHRRPATTTTRHTATPLHLRQLSPIPHRVLHYIPRVSGPVHTSHSTNSRRHHLRQFVSRTNHHISKPPHRQPMFRVLHREIPHRQSDYPLAHRYCLPSSNLHHLRQHDSILEYLRNSCTPKLQHHQRSTRDPHKFSPHAHQVLSHAQNSLSSRS